MLISLILICSLAQLASAGASPVNSGGCGTHYICYAPDKCLNPPAQTIMANSKVVEIRKKDKIMNDCDAIIRFYRYDDKKTLVSIESFQDTVKKIEFKQNEDDPNDQDYANQMDLSFFSCEIDATSGKTKGMFFDKLVMEKDITSGKLTCKFEGKRDAPWAQDNLFKKDSDWLTIITYDSNMSPSSTKPAKSRGDIDVRCDPQDFEFIKPTDDRTKLYKEVSTINKPETYQCDDIALFKMEFKKKGSDSYEEAKSIKCVDYGEAFEVFDKDNQGNILEEAVEIRCVAETKFFCKDSFKRKDGEQFPKLAENDDGSTLLMCPTDKPHLVIAGEVERYITNPEFKCVTLGKEPIWTVKNGNREEIFTKTGPIAYCSDRKNCTQPISESAVVDGTLGPDFLPKCSDRGTLKTTDNMDVTTSRCDHSDGVYKYTAGGEEKAIKDDTMFICEYPPDDDGG
ncbi:hypothetical protein PRIPAC_94954 [Pristionchus pacificus]|uniref:Uncharacterized protein n=1 Tax=Pristionchus pacificus TaxID=54126 RepID=A0A2A6CHQ5_PRIPA|nr:hypothetical protein PRIPAC_94954 [Pristionchus pacificus]|eukprot:PDM77755.1 hypothetical protein PRIPAC_34622 [Pristionchus pacificus]